MTIEINKDARKEAIASIERYFQENMEERIGNIAAGALLGFPSILPTATDGPSLPPVRTPKNPKHPRRR